MLCGIVSITPLPSSSDGPAGQADEAAAEQIDRRLRWLLDHEHRFPEGSGFIITDDYNPMESRQIRKAETYRTHFLKRIAFDLLLR